MSAVETFTPTDPEPITFSARAAARVRQLAEVEGKKALMLRVYITGGGCSGFQYGFTLDEAHADDDALINTAGSTLVVDAMSFQYLTGSRIDFEEGLEGARFTVTNPNAVTTCGCGMSFTL
ncbi:MAG: iron-sulfur cluster insertion protein ErpA [Kistimonas sp.]|nr:iron-sulfur cluster insertion protein ErpA [Kistimonas sp.]